MPGPPRAKVGALTEFRRVLGPEVLKEMEEALVGMHLDLSDPEHVLAVHAELVVKLFAGLMSPEIAGSIQESLNAAATLAAARAQGLFDSEDAIDGAMALAQAARNAQARRLTRRTSAPALDVIDDEDTEF